MAIAAALAVGLLLRLLLLPRYLPIGQTGDGPGYLFRAEQILAGEVMGAPGGIAQRGPVYPLFIAFLFALGPNSPETVLVAQALLSVATAYVGYLLARRAGEHRGLLVGAALALYPPFLFWSLQPLSETLFLLLLVLSVYLVDRSRHDGGKPSTLVALGLAAASGALCRPTGLVYIPPILLALVSRCGIRRTALAAAVMALLLCTWTARNVVRLGAPVLTTTNSGVNFYVGNSQKFLDDPNLGSSIYYADEELRSQVEPLGELGADRALFQRGKAFLLADTGRAFRLAWHKLRYFYRPFPRADTAVRWLSFISLLTALGFAISPIYRRRLRPGPTWMLCAALIVLTTLVHVIYFPSGRFRLPVEALLLLMAADADGQK